MSIYAIRWVRGAAVRLQSVMFGVLHRREFGPGVRVFGWPIVALVKGSRVAVGCNAWLISNSHFSESGVNHPCILRTRSPEAVLRVGDNVGISGCTVCAAGSVTIGNECLLGANVLITDTDLHPVDSDNRRWRSDNVRVAPVTIADNVFVGAGAMIPKGVTVGENAVIGAGSVVTSDVPKNAVVAGSPARGVGTVG